VLTHFGMKLDRLAGFGNNRPHQAKEHAVTKRAFRTSFGREIEFVEGFFDPHRRAYLDDPAHLFDNWPQDRRMSFWGFCRDVFEYAVMVDFLAQSGIPMDWERLLDIGGAEGTMARLFRGEKRAKHVTVVEANQQGFSLPDELFKTLFDDFQGVIRGGLTDPRCRARGFRGMVDQFGYHPPRSSVFHNLDLRADPIVDQYRVQDIYKLEEQYDCATAFLCVPWFDLEQLFPKVYSLLSDSGVFCVLEGNWWYPVNATMIVGDFPYACQRLTRDDLGRYFDENRPDQTERVLKRYDWFHQGKQHPTLDDYVDLAHRAGFSLLAARRFTPACDIHEKTPVSPLVVDRYDHGYLDEVLADIHHFRPDVRLTDLHTAKMMMVFGKQPRPRDGMNSYLRRMKDEGNYGTYLLETMGP
jgi:hypothetical protein